LTGVPGADFKGRLDAFSKALKPRDTEFKLTWIEPGYVRRHIYCRPIKFSYTTTPMYSIGYVEWAAMFVASDPRMYDDQNPVQSYAFHPTASSNSFNANNAGTFKTPPFMHIDGPVTNPTITNEATGKFLKLNMTLVAGDFLDIDFKAKTIRGAGGTTKYSFLDPSSVWWGIEPGDNTIIFDTTGSDADTTLLVAWRSAWR
jgi:phage-related protein